MSIDELLDTVAERFREMGADDPFLAQDLKQGARGQCTRILDKFGRFTPIDSVPNGFFLQRTFKEGSEYVAEVGIDSPDGVVPAAVVRYTTE